MTLPRAAAWRNPARWYLLVGTALIASSLWLPWAAAARTTRVEQRAERLAELLLRAASGMPFPPLDDPDHVLARFYALALADGAFVADVERVEPTPPDVLLAFTNKHYAFQLAASPPDPLSIVGRNTVPALEVLAWPLASGGPAHSAYLCAENAPRAYSRNLGGRLVGLADHRPMPGVGQRRATPNPFDTVVSYRSDTDERWLLF
jgi:hypothetical protein